MSFEAIWTVVQGFLLNIGAPLILILIALDVVLGIAAALKRGEFQWPKVWQFYRTMILPYLITYVALQVATTLMPEMPGALAFIVSGLPGIAFATIIGALGTSIIGHIKSIGVSVPEG